MKILVLNGGSSSHKLCLYDWPKDGEPVSQSTLWERHISWHSSFNPDTLTEVLSTLWTGDNRVLAEPTEIAIVGHRVVHGGPTYQSSVVITPEVKTAIAQLSPLAPVHNPINLAGIELIEQLLGDVIQVAVFDTAFHSQMPAAAAIYPGPYGWIEQGIRRYGFHGISHQYCAQRAAQLLQRDLTQLKLIICHLGNGASLSAVTQGQCINTTMGFTPLDGLMMGTRSGAIDPGIVIYLMRQGHSADEIDRLLNKASGLKGISGISHDLREIEQAIAAGNERAQLALEIYIHRLASCLGDMLVSLGGVDALVFTAGVGEHSATVRASACEALAFLGLKLDPIKNAQGPVDQEIAASDSTVRVLVIQTQEDWAIAQDCLKLYQAHGQSQKNPNA